MKAYNLYNNPTIEKEVDNVVLALLSYVGNSTNKFFREFVRIILDDRALSTSNKTERKRELEYIREFIKRHNSNHFGYGRIYDFVSKYTIKN